MEFILQIRAMRSEFHYIHDLSSIGGTLEGMRGDTGRFLGILLGLAILFMIGVMLTIFTKTRARALNDSDKPSVEVIQPEGRLRKKISKSAHNGLSQDSTFHHPR